ncbi:chromate transporter [Bacillus sp. 1P06AnD]|uniref:chromate transporter n=1 Tax=Bacillus sp. 1P06AnD TaxID=3132208 RepID=UPI0039A26CA5
MIYKELFMAFFRVGMLGYGGGPSAIPLIKIEAVDGYKWMGDEEFSDLIALANALPGPIATKLAGYIGYRQKGWLGMVVAIVASVLPTVIIMIVFLSLISSYRDKPWVQGMTNAVIPVVGVMLATMTWDFAAKSSKTMGWIKTIVFIAAGYLLMEVINIPTPIVIIIVLFIALILPASKKSVEGKKVEQ